MHLLKLWPEYMKDKKSGFKPWELRLGDDRKFNAGEEVLFMEWSQQSEAFTGISYGPVVITYVHRDPVALPGRCIFSHSEPKCS